MAMVAERCIYCHNLIEFREDAELVRCNHCGQKIGVTEFSRFKKKVEAAETASLRAIRELQEAQKTSGSAAQQHLAELQEAVESTQSKLDSLRDAYLMSKNAETQNLYELAEMTQSAGHFDEAEKYYRDVQVRCGHDAEVHWRIVLCRYGVEYVRENATGEYLPTIGHLRTESILEDPDCKAAIAYAGSEELRDFYRMRASQIDSILQEYAQIKKSNTYDVFISVKQADEGHPTTDSDKAIQLYHMLSGWGLKVFNSRVSLPMYAGEAYEPRIIAALMSAKVMIVVGTKPEFITAPWVRSEWRRFHWLSKRDKSRKLMVYLSGMSPSALPNEISYLESIVEGPQSAEHLKRSLGDAFPKLRESGKPKDPPVDTPPTPPADSFNLQAALNSVKVDLQYGQWAGAEKQLDKIREHAPYDSTACLYALMAERKVSHEEDLSDQFEPLTKSIHFGRAMEFGTPKEKKRLTELNQRVLEHIDAIANYQGSTDDAANHFTLTQREPDNFLHWWRYCVCLTNNLTAADSRAQNAYKRACELASPEMRAAMKNRYTAFESRLNANREQSIVDAENRLRELEEQKADVAERIRKGRELLSSRPVEGYEAAVRKSKNLLLPIAVLIAVAALVCRLVLIGYPVFTFLMTPSLILRGFLMGTFWPVHIAILVDLMRAVSYNAFSGAQKRIANGGSPDAETHRVCGWKKKSLATMWITIAIAVLYWGLSPYLDDAISQLILGVSQGIDNYAMFQFGGLFIGKNMSGMDLIVYVVSSGAIAAFAYTWHKKCCKLFDSFTQSNLSGEQSTKISASEIRSRINAFKTEEAELNAKIDEARKQLKSLQK